MLLPMLLKKIIFDDCYHFFCERFIKTSFHSDPALISIITLLPPM